MVARDRERCFGDDKRDRDYLGWMSFGFFLLIVGIVFIVNTNIISDFRVWAEQMVNEQHLTRPPKELINSAVLFFSLLGLSDFFKAGIRFWSDPAGRRGLGETLSGVAVILFAYLIHLYGNYALTWQQSLAIEVVSIGLLVVLYSIVRYKFLKSPL